MRPALLSMFQRNLLEPQPDTSPHEGIQFGLDDLNVSRFDLYETAVKSPGLLLFARVGLIGIKLNSFFLKFQPFITGSHFTVCCVKSYEVLKNAPLRKYTVILSGEKEK